MHQVQTDLNIGFTACREEVARVGAESKRLAAQMESHAQRTAELLAQVGIQRDYLAKIKQYVRLKSPTVSNAVSIYCNLLIPWRLQCEYWLRV